MFACRALVGGGELDPGLLTEDPRRLATVGLLGREMNIHSAQTCGAMCWPA
jgi:hypothetical protein